MESVNITKERNTQVESARDPTNRAAAYQAVVGCRELEVRVAIQYEGV